MPGPYPLATLSATIDENGITAPPFEDILASLQASYRQIYGSDADLEPDAQDGQWLGVQAQAIYNTNQTVIAAYLSYAPTYAQGVGLASVVKINGLRKLSPSSSTVELLVVGQVGTIINNGVASDTFQFNWNLPAQVIIPVEGQILVTATAALPGATLAAPNTITTIATPTPGWQTVTNPQSAFPGNPLETDATLRKRQTISTALPSITPREGLEAAIANVPGVGRSQVYDNDRDIYDENLIPPHSIAVVVEGGDAQALASTILKKKNTGCGTYGTTQQIVFDQAGVPQTINFFFLTLVPIFVEVFVQPLPGYLDTTGSLIIAALAQHISSLDIGEAIYHSKLVAPANLSGEAAILASGKTQLELDVLSDTFVTRGIHLGVAADALNNVDVIIPFESAASANASNITLTLTP